MKRIFAIIITLIISLLSAPSTTTEAPPVTAKSPPQTATTVYSEQVYESTVTHAKTAFVSKTEEINSIDNTTKPMTNTSQTKQNKTESFTEECTEITEQPTISDRTVKCINEGDQTLAEYKPQIGGQPNPFEDDTPTDITEHPVEEYMVEGGYRPGEGIHF